MAHGRLSPQESVQFVVCRCSYEPLATCQRASENPLDLTRLGWQVSTRPERRRKPPGAVSCEEGRWGAEAAAMPHQSRVSDPKEQSRDTTSAYKRRYDFDPHEQTFFPPLAASSRDAATGEESETPATALQLAVDFSAAGSCWRFGSFGHPFDPQPEGLGKARFWCLFLRHLPPAGTPHLYLSIFVCWTRPSADRLPADGLLWIQPTPALFTLAI